MHPFFSSSRPLVFAHRGGSALAPENTLAAFDNGMALGADGLELDVHLSRDGIVVVHHDKTLDRPTTLSGPIAARDVSELAHVGVPTLADVLARYPNVPIVIELKVNSVAMAAGVIDVVPRAPAGHCAGRGARRGALGPLSQLVPLAGDARRVGRLSGSGVCRAHARRLETVRRRCARGRAGRAGGDGEHRTSSA